ncbi:MAG: DegT/DnrJ/EryC1/StrS family aminotransferase [Acidobacteriota bacterium]
MQPSVIPVVNLVKQNETIRAELEEAVLRALHSGNYILGPEVAAFEKEIAQYCNVPHAIACASGTDAIMLALMAIGFKPGDEVIMPSFTIYVDPEVVSLMNGVPRFAEIDARTFNINPDQIAAQITPRTRAIIVTHLYGLTAEMDPIMALAREHKLIVIEDACQAIGSTYRGHMAGNIGDFGCFSFYPTKNLGGYGDGGLITTQNDEYAALLRRLRTHGFTAKYFSNEVGMNSRLDEIQAAALRVKLRRLDQWTQRRHQLAAHYNEGLSSIAEVQIPFIPAHCQTNYHQYTIRAQRRDELKEFLAQQGIQSAIHYPLAPFQQKVYIQHYLASDYPEALKAVAEVLSLPLFAELEFAEVDRVIDTIKQFYR